MPNEFGLRECPFCGEGKIVLFYDDPYDGYQGAQCGHHIAQCCGCGANVSRFDKNEAVAAWNRGANDEQV